MISSLAFHAAQGASAELDPELFVALSCSESYGVLPEMEFNLLSRVFLLRKKLRPLSHQLATLINDHWTGKKMKPLYGF